MRTILGLLGLTCFEYMATLISPTFEFPDVLAILLLLCFVQDVMEILKD